MTAATLGSLAPIDNNLVRVASTASVDQAVTRLTAAVKESGAEVFAVIDYAKGVASVGGSLRPTSLVIFGGPKIGASAVSVGQTMGLYLPLRILAYEDQQGRAWLMYNDPAEAAEVHGIPKDHPAVRQMQTSLEKMAAIAAGR